MPEEESAAELVRIRSFSNDGELFLAKTVLESAGIDAMASAPLQPTSLARSFGVGVPATDLYVRGEDFVLANEILTRAAEDS